MSHYARFTGYHSLKRYEFYEHAPGDVYAYYTPIPYDPWEDTNLLYKGQLDDPVLESGKRIYLHTLGKSVDVIKVERSTDGTYTYLTNYEIERQEDEQTKNSLEYAQMKKKHYEDKWDIMTDNRSEYVDPNRPWWKRLFS